MKAVNETSHMDFEQHNQEQRRYFERIVKRTMVPVDSPYLRRHVDEALSFASVTKGERVLEVGCGMGRYTLLLAGRGVRVEGVDISKVLLDRLREFNNERYDIPLHCMDVSEPPAGLEGSFDAVIGFFMLHHVHSLDECFRAMARLLKRGGRAVFVEPNPYNPLYYAQILLTPGMTWQAERGIRNMRRKIIFRAMENAGLTRPAMARFGFFPPFVANRPWGARLERRLEAVPFWRGMLPFQLFRGERL